jgi:hypothetical protein
MPVLRSVILLRIAIFEGLNAIEPCPRGKGNFYREPSCTASEFRSTLFQSCVFGLGLSFDIPPSK